MTRKTTRREKENENAVDSIFYGETKQGKTKTKTKKKKKKKKKKTKKNK
jgi:hypothetical protein